MHRQQIISVSTENLDGLDKIAEEITEVSGLSTVNTMSQDCTCSNGRHTNYIDCLSKQVAVPCIYLVYIPCTIRTEIS